VEPGDGLQSGQEVRTRRQNQPDGIISCLRRRKQQVEQVPVRLAAGQQFLELVDHHKQRAILAAQEPGGLAEPFLSQPVDLTPRFLQRQLRLLATPGTEHRGGQLRPRVGARPDQRHRPLLLLLQRRD
jgi:hypothetical protein